MVEYIFVLLGIARFQYAGEKEVGEKDMDCGYFTLDSSCMRISFIDIETTHIPARQSFRGTLKNKCVH